MLSSIFHPDALLWLWILAIVAFLSMIIIWSFIKKSQKKWDIKRSYWIISLLILFSFLYYLYNSPFLWKVVEFGQRNIEKTEESRKDEIDYIATETGSFLEEKVDLSELIWFKLLSFDLVDGDYSKDFQFWYEIENKSGKELLWVKWKFEVYDIFDDKLSEFDIYKIGSIGSGTTLSEKSNYYYNAYIDDDVRLWETKFEDMRYTYEITELIYLDDYDSTQKLLGKNTGQDVYTVDYSIISKNARKWDYTHHVDYDIVVTNNSSKDIKGIKWKIISYNIFWDELANYDFRFTKGIKTWETLQDTIKISINEYIEKELELYNTDFDFLKYSFDIESVIYIE